MLPRRSSFILTSLMLGALLLAALPASAAVTLVSLSATAQGAAVRIDWETATETDTVGFYIQRSLQRESGYTRISSLILTKGEFTTGAVYEYLDEQVEYGVLYYYYLEVLNTDQSSDLEGPVWSGPGLTPTPIPSRTPTASRTLTATRRPQATATPRPATATSRPPGPTSQGPIATWTVPPLPTSRPSSTSAPLPSATARSLPSATSPGQPTSPRASQPTSTTKPTSRPSATPVEPGQGNPLATEAPPEPTLVWPTVALPPATPNQGMGAQPTSTATPEPTPLPGEVDPVSGLPPATAQLSPTPTLSNTSAQAAEATPRVANSGQATAIAALAPTSQEAPVGPSEVAAAHDISNADHLRQGLLVLIITLLAYQAYRYARARQLSE